MDKESFLTELRKRLTGLPQEELEERIAFYSEMIDERMNSGMTESDAVAGIGTIDQIVERIMSEIPLKQLVEDKVKQKSTLKGWQIALLVLGAPLWIPLLIAAAAVLFSGWVAIGAVILSLWAADLSLAAGAAACLFTAGIYLRAGNSAGAFFSLGMALLCAGLAVLLFFACAWITRGMLKLTGRMLTGLKTAFVGKEA